MNSGQVIFSTNLKEAIRNNDMHPGYAFLATIKQGSVAESMRMFLELYVNSEGYNNQSINTLGLSVLKMDKGDALQLMNEKVFSEGKIQEMLMFQHLVIFPNLEQVEKLNETHDTQVLRDQLGKEYTKIVDTLKYNNEADQAQDDFTELRKLLMDIENGKEKDVDFNKVKRVSTLYEKLAFSDNPDVVAALVAKHMTKDTDKLTVNQQFNHISPRNFIKNMSNLNDYLYNIQDIVNLICYKAEAGETGSAAMDRLDETHAVLTENYRKNHRIDRGNIHG